MSKFANVLHKDPLPALFTILLLLITVSTFRHTAYGFASLEQGGLFWGALSALAIDAGMAISMIGLRRKRSWSLIVGAFLTAASSTMAQIVYALQYADSVTVAQGADWLSGFAMTVLNWRVIILPCLPPLLAAIYSISGNVLKENGAHDPMSKLERAEEIMKLMGESAPPLAKIMEELE